MSLGVCRDGGDARVGDRQARKGESERRDQVEQGIVLIVNYGMCKLRCELGMGCIFYVYFFERDGRIASAAPEVHPLRSALRTSARPGGRRARGRGAAAGRDARGARSSPGSSTSRALEARAGQMSKLYTTLYWTNSRNTEYMSTTRSTCEHNSPTPQRRYVYVFTVTHHRNLPKSDRPRAASTVRTSARLTCPWQRPYRAWSVGSRRCAGGSVDRRRCLGRSSGCGA